ncbi:MAG: anthranilate synthase component I [Phormidesmis sp. CAN_BIN36]|nr:anthranilate synthase component I [Phormidesmis sp. CAN_BIN36]
MDVILPWRWRSLPLDQKTGSEVFAALFRSSDAIATLLESPYLESADGSLANYSMCAGAPRGVAEKPQMWTPEVGEILPFLQQLLDRPNLEQFDLAPASLPFQGGWLGWLGYDLAWEIERLPTLKSDSLPFPIAYWYEPACFAVLDHQQQILWLAATEVSQLDQMQEKLASVADQESPVLTEMALKPVAFHLSQTDYESAILRAKKHIQAGDIFQANLSLRFETQTFANSWSIYQALQQINPSPFASYWQTPWGAVISCSPERLVKLQGTHAETRPIAGTYARGMNPAQDRQFAQDLLNNAKEQAEHIMLVDLARNDLGRVCEWGSVRVDELLTIERYSHVLHLVSNLVGTLNSQYTAVDLIRALFPGGTITGCPKVRCLEIIEALEPDRRSLFYGSCGYLDLRGNLDLNILIRTLLYAPQADGTNIVWGQVGAGIVADSDPEREWHESLHKAQAQLAALKLATSSEDRV